MSINKDWHLNHRMPKNATLEQRARWHAGHLRVCNCRRDLPKDVAEFLTGKKQLKAPKQSKDAVML